MLYWLARRMREMQEVSRDERGFTLIELLIVIIIIGILAAIALPTFLAQRDKATAAKCRSDVRNAAEAAVLYASNNEPNNAFTGLNLQAAKDQGFNPSPGINWTDASFVVSGANDEDVTITGDCPDPVTDAVWTTVDGDPYRGVVTGGDVS